MQTESKTFRVTPAGRVYMRFITILNTGNPARIGEFVDDYCADEMLNQFTPAELVELFKQTHQETGGMDIHRVYLTEEHYIIVIVKARKDNAIYMDKLKVTPGHPFKIVEYNHTPAPG